MMAHPGQPMMAQAQPMMAPAQPMMVQPQVIVQQPMQQMPGSMGVQAAQSVMQQPFG